MRVHQAQNGWCWLAEFNPLEQTPSMPSGFLATQWQIDSMCRCRLKCLFWPVHLAGQNSERIRTSRTPELFLNLVQSSGIVILFCWWLAKGLQRAPHANRCFGNWSSVATSKPPSPPPKPLTPPNPPNPNLQAPKPRHPETPKAAASHPRSWGANQGAALPRRRGRADPGGRGPAQQEAPGAAARRGDMGEVRGFRKWGVVGGGEGGGGRGFSFPEMGIRPQSVLIIAQRVWIRNAL